MNRFDFRIYYHIIRIIKTIRRIYYGGERSSMARNAEPIIISTVEFDYIGTDEQFNTFLNGYSIKTVICCGCTEVARPQHSREKRKENTHESMVILPFVTR